jgi:hypothetical protein
VDCCRRSKGDVLLTCKVPRERVLLSHCVGWRSVLNGSPLVPDLAGESDEDFDARLNRVFDDFEIGATGSRYLSAAYRPKDLRTEVEQGRESILEPGKTTAVSDPGRPQCTSCAPTMCGRGSKAEKPPSSLAPHRPGH